MENNPYSMKQMMQDQKELEEHKKAGTGSIEMKFISRNSRTIGVEIKALADVDMMETGVKELVKKIAQLKKKSIVQLMAGITADMMMQQEFGDEDEDDDD